MLAALAGCANHHDDGDRAGRAEGGASDARPKDAAAENRTAARDKLREAEQAEAAGQYARAMEAYQQLRSFPRDSQPTDLEQRIRSLRQKMADADR